MEQQACSRAVEIAGGPTALARRLHITPQAVSLWGRVPIERVNAVSEITGIPAHDLRPDIFPAPTHQEGG